MQNNIYPVIGTIPSEYKLLLNTHVGGFRIVKNGEEPSNMDFYKTVFIGTRDECEIVRAGCSTRRDTSGYVISNWTYLFYKYNRGYIVA